MANYTTPVQDRVVEFLSNNGIGAPPGEVYSRSGLASRLLADAMQTNTKALASVLREMEDRGLLAREVQGRRTYRIRLLAEPRITLPPMEPKVEPKVEPEVPTEGLNYEALANQLLARCAEVLANGRGDNKSRDQIGHLQGILLDERKQKQLLEERLARAEENNGVLSARVSELETEVRHLRSKLRDTHSHGGFRLMEMLDDSSREALEKLMKEPRS